LANKGVEIVEMTVETPVETTQGASNIIETTVETPQGVSQEASNTEPVKPEPVVESTYKAPIDAILKNLTTTAEKKSALQTAFINLTKSMATMTEGTQKTYLQ
jgi:hypothetical protein